MNQKKLAVKLIVHVQHHRNVFHHDELHTKCILHSDKWFVRFDYNRNLLVENNNSFLKYRCSHHNNLDQQDNQLYHRHHYLYRLNTVHHQELVKGGAWLNLYMKCHSNTDQMDNPWARLSCNIQRHRLTVHTSIDPMDRLYTYLTGTSPRRRLAGSTTSNPVAYRNLPVRFDFRILNQEVA